MVAPLSRILRKASVLLVTTVQRVATCRNLARVVLSPQVLVTPTSPIVTRAHLDVTVPQKVQQLVSYLLSVEIATRLEIHWPPLDVGSVPEVVYHTHGRYNWGIDTIFFK